MNAEANPHLVVLERRFAAAKVLFESARRERLVVGDFNASRWLYRGRAVSLDRDGLRHGFSQAVAKVVLAPAIASGKSWELVYSRLVALSLLGTHLDSEGRTWEELSASDLDRVRDKLRESSASVSTVYHRSAALATITDTLCSIEDTVHDELYSFLRRPFKWRHGIRNPIRARLDCTTEQFATHSARKHVEELDLHVASARRHVMDALREEPRPGYFRIRIESLLFMLAMGIRVGQLTRMPINCVRYEAQGALLFVPAQKGFPGQWRPVPEAWAEAVGQAADYLSSACVEARARAREIEVSGFTWVTGRLATWRERVGMEGAVAATCRLFHLDATTHFTVREICSALGITPKELSKTDASSYGRAAIPVCSTTVARCIDWFDRRMALWDWRQFVSSRTAGGRRGAHPLSLKVVSRLSECSPADLQRSVELRALILRALDRVVDAGGFDTEHARTSSVARVQKWWIRTKAIFLRVRCDRRRTLISSERLVEILEERFLAVVSRHYGVQVRDTSCSELPGESLRLSEHLLVLWERQFGLGRSSLGILPRPMNRGDLYNFLCSNAQKKTVFDSFDIRDSHGARVSLTPHQFRHWVNTAVRRSGAPEMLVDLWMGRQPGQGRHYDHRTAVERANFVRDRYMQPNVPDDWLGRAIARWRLCGMEDAEISDVVCRKLKAIHFVPWGMCSRDLIASPCDRGLMCLRGFGGDSVCPSFHIDAQDLKALDNIRRMRARYLEQLHTFESNIEELTSSLDELHGGLALDQHVKWIVQVIAGCDAAILAYGSSSDCRRIRPVADFVARGQQ